ncbi:transforming growth factor-beta-induced protein ig-h3 [Ptiloglossa arizonensis]|uniref:transforming growth factor-beta-induced protein ig-h3 n=1 Tax=Ptiloglossa arizonensis TaxID=3350558 RepID=UPI003FA106FB
MCNGIETRVVILSAILAAVYANRRGSRWRNGNARITGPNVCAVEVNDDINYIYYTESRQWNPRNICGAQTFVRYECCAGYYRVPGHSGFTGVKPLMNLVETARRVASTKFARPIETSSLADELRVGPPFTLFAPSDEAFDSYLQTKGIPPEWLLDGNRFVDLIRNHLIDGRVLSNQWRANLSISTRHRGIILRINKFADGMETVNCHRIVRKDQIATNGVVHVIDGVSDLALAPNSDVIELAANDGRCEIFAKALESSELGNRIGSSETPCTIFAPTDHAFRNIPKEQLNDLLANPDAMNALIAHHIVTRPVCLSNVISEHRETTMQQQELTLNCGPRGLVVDRANLKNETHHARNGLLYIIDRVLLPDRARTVLDVARDEGLLAFTEIIRTAELQETLRRLKRYTMFAPCDAAIHSLSNRQLAELRSDRETARDFVRNRIVAGTYFTNEMTSNRVVRTLEVGAPLRFQVYRGKFGIENALILKADRGCSNGVLHVISRVLQPAEQSLDHILRREGNFSIWMDAMERIKGIQPDIYDDYKRANSSCTYFVPSDKAFRRLGNTRLRKLFEDNNYLTKTVKNHIAKNMLLSESFMPDLRYTVKTKENMVNIVRKNDKVLVNDATLVKPDILNKAGVAHEINSVLLPEYCSPGYRRTRNGIVGRVCV